MLKIAFCLYRQWGFDVANNIIQYQKERKDFKIGPVILSKTHQIKIPANTKKHLDIFEVDPNDIESIYKILKKYHTEVVCMYSWSWIVKEPVLSNFICLCLHPSLVPQNRGGTPIQNQIMAGVENSGISLFKMDKGIDSGPVYKQTVMSLIGDINDIFRRMVELGTILSKNLISDYINGYLKFKPQNTTNKPSVLKRRKPEQSEIKKSDLKDMTFDQLNSFVGSLLYPYPNAYFVKNNKIIYLQKVVLYPKRPTGLFLKLKNGYAKITKYEVKSIDNTLTSKN